MNKKEVITSIDKLVRDTEFKVNKTSYENIVRDISSWPQWKRELCNEDLMISVNSIKIKI